MEVLVADLADRAATAWCATGSRTGPDPVDLLVNNAGFGLSRSFLDNDLAVEEARLDVMVRAVLLTCHAAGRAMRERGQGAIVNVSSVASFVANGTYSAEKAFVTVFSEALASEARRHRGHRDGACARASPAPSSTSGHGSGLGAARRALARRRRRRPAGARRRGRGQGRLRARRAVEGRDRRGASPAAAARAGRGGAGARPLPRPGATDRPPAVSDRPARSWEARDARARSARHGDVLEVPAKYAIPPQAGTRSSPPRACSTASARW